MSIGVPRQSDPSELFTRAELVALREKARALVHPDMNEGWARAYQRLADAADTLDAFFGRSSVCPTCFPITPPADCKADPVPESARSPEPCS